MSKHPIELLAAIGGREFESRAEAEAAAVAVFNSRYALLFEGGKTGYIDWPLEPSHAGTPDDRLVVQISAKADMTALYENATLFFRKDGDLKAASAFTLWAKSPGRRTYIGTTFAPRDVSGKLNLWFGYGVEPAPGD